MKKIAFLIGFFLVMSMCRLTAQNVAITDDNTYSAHASAMLDVKSTSKGLLIPRLTTAQRTTLGATAATGLLVYDTNLNSFYFWNGTAWTNLTSGSASGLWGLNSPYVFLNNTNYRVGVGTTAPTGKMEVKADATLGANDPIFNVVSKNGDTIFAVYDGGVRINVYDDPLVKSSGNKGGFAVGGFTPSKGTYTNEYLRVTPDSVRIYIEEGDMQKSSGNKGGFAVGGFTPSKSIPTDYFNIYGSSYADSISPSVPRIFWYPLKEALLSGRVLVQSPDSVGTNSFATGFESKAIGDYSQAMGYSARAFGDYSTAIGNFADARSNNSFAFGDYAKAIGAGSYAIGSNSVASGNYSTSFGFDNTSSGAYSTSFGKGTTASGQYSFSAGYNSIASGYNSYSLGLTCSATATSSFATGYLSNATALYSYAMGFQATASNSYAYALGYNATASNSYAYALGSNATAGGQYSFAQGNSVQALNTGSIAMGYSSLSNGDYGVAIGYNSEAFTDGVAMGRDATATGSSAFALGYSTSSTGIGSYAMGYDATASGNYTTAMGYSSTASATDAVAIGHSAYAHGVDGIAIGHGADATWGGVAFGLNADAGTGFWGTALGANSEATGAYSVAIGGGVASGGGSKAIGLITASGDYSFGIALSSGLSATNVAQSNAMAIMGGNVGINTITPGMRLHIKQSATNRCFRIESNATTDYWDLGVNSSTNKFRFMFNGAWRAEIDDATGAYTQSSDRRLKKDIEPLGNVLDKVLMLQPSKYHYIQNDNNIPKTIGFIAQDVQLLFPDLVKESTDDNNNKYLGLAYDDFAVLSIQAIIDLNKKFESKLVEQQAEIDLLKKQNIQLLEKVNEINTLKAEIDEMKKNTKTANK